MKRIIDSNLTDSELIRQFDTAIHRPVSDRLSKFFVRIPDFGSCKTARQFSNLGTRNTTFGTASEKIIEIKRLDRIVRLDSVTRSLCAKTGAFCSLVSRITSMAVSGLHQLVMILFGNDKKLILHKNRPVK